MLISTKNVFAPGAKFGAYSATKAAHQLARIASLELAEIVCVLIWWLRMQLSHGETEARSVEYSRPDRMKAEDWMRRGLKSTTGTEIF